jgi:hypothetical protein
MAKKRFLRDKVLHTMLDDITRVSEMIENEQMPMFTFKHSMCSLAGLYQTNKLILEHLEEAIEQLKTDGKSQDAIDNVVKAAAHIQLGLVEIHQSIKTDFDTLHEAVAKLRELMDVSVLEDLA